MSARAPAADAKPVPAEWVGRRAEYARDSTVHRLFEEQARATPASVAVECGDVRLTYAEVDARTNRLARHLRSLGVGEGTLVPTCLGRSPDIVVAFLAILKAGGAFVPLEPSYPPQRLAFMLEDCSAAFVLADADGASHVPPGPWRTVRLDEARAEIDALPSAPLDPAGAARSRAYVMYTSGSTGRPKGVVVPHRAIVRLVRATDFARMDASETWLQLAPVSFDASTLEIWAPLLNGGRCVIFPERMPSVESIREAIRRHGVTSVWLTSSLFNTVIDADPDALAPLRQLLTGGEALSPVHVRRGLDRLPATQLINGYGPTENTTFTCCHRIPRDADTSRSIPIGRPIVHTTVHVLDEAGRPVAVGAEGELFTGGDGVALEYLNNPELTAARFVPDPFSADEGARMYRTGDRVRWAADGTIEFLGRMDQQVKIRGFRIEPGEIETALLRHAGLRQAAVIAREDVPGDRRLVAYTVAADPAAPPSADALRALLQRELPPHMVPSAFVEIAELPLTSNGKLDRAALPAPRRAAAEPDRPGEQGGDPTEDVVLATFRETFPDQRVGLDDDFFDLGGHSILGLRLVAVLNKRLAAEIRPPELFDCPTARSLAARVRGGAPDAARPARSSTVAQADLAAVAAAARRHAGTPQRSSSAVYRMRESAVCRFLLAPFYGLRSRFVRTVVQYLVLKFEGGQWYSRTMRRLYERHHDMRIGDYSGMVFDVGQFKRGTTIGRYCEIDPTARIETANHPTTTISSHGIFYRGKIGFNPEFEIPRNRVEIGSDVFIGRNALILFPTKRIGHGAVIGAGALVTFDVPPYAVVAGYPATIVRYRFSPARIEELLASKWWDASLEDLAPVREQFLRPVEGDRVR